MIENWGFIVLIIAAVVALILTTIVGLLAWFSNRPPVRYIYRDREPVVAPEGAAPGEPAPREVPAQPEAIIAERPRRLAFIGIALVWTLLIMVLIAAVWWVWQTWGAVFLSWIDRLKTPAEPPAIDDPATPVEPFDWSVITNPWNDFVTYVASAELWGLGLLFFVLAVIFSLFKRGKVANFFAWLGAIVISVAVAELLLGVRISTFLGEDPALLGALILLGIGTFAFLILKSKVLGMITFALGLLALANTLPILSSLTGIYSGTRTITAPVGECSTPIIVNVSDNIDWWGDDPHGEAFRVRYTNKHGTWVSYKYGTKPTMRAICFISNEATAQKVHYRFVRK